MPTYIEVVNNIQNDILNRTTYSAQVKRAIQRTIRHYERERFWFNETATTLVCVPSVETVTVPTNMIAFPDLLQVRENSNDRELVVAPFATIRHINCNNSVGLPTQYAMRGNSFYLANVPDSAYALPCFYLKKLTALSADADTNKWLSAAEDVVTYGAAKIVWANTIRNISAANVCAGLESDAIKELSRAMQGRTPGRIRPTKF